MTTSQLRKKLLNIIALPTTIALLTSAALSPSVLAEKPSELEKGRPSWHAQEAINQKRAEQERKRDGKRHAESRINQRHADRGRGHDNHHRRQNNNRFNNHGRHHDNRHNAFSYGRNYRAYSDYRRYRDYKRRHFGHRLHHMPKHAHRLRHRDYPLYYVSGYYYRPYSGGYISISAPIGTRIKHLPTGFATLAIGSAIYYLANDVYYRKERDEYVVVSAPTNANYDYSDTSSSSDVYSNGNWAIYPSAGQSPEQLENDRYQCHRWAKGQTGYDPTQHNPNPNQRAPYCRAQAACLEGRGYTVR